MSIKLVSNCTIDFFKFILVFLLLSKIWFEKFSMLFIFVSILLIANLSKDLLCTDSIKIYLTPNFSNCPEFNKLYTVSI